MAAAANFHAMPHSGRYCVRRTGSKRASLAGMTKDGAWLEARRRARIERAKAYLHDSGGRIVARNDYGETA